MALNEFHVDTRKFVKAFLMGAEPVMDWDDDTVQKVDPEGRPLFLSSVAVQQESNFGMQNEILKVTSATPDKKNPEETMVGREVDFKDLVVKHWKMDNGKSGLKATADLIFPRNHPQPKQQ